MGHREGPIGAGLFVRCPGCIARKIWGADPSEPARAAADMTLPLPFKANESEARCEAHCAQPLVPDESFV